MLPGFEPRPQLLEFNVPGPARGKDFAGFNIGERVMVVPDRNSQNYMKLIEDAANTARSVFGEWIIPELGVPVRVWVTVKIWSEPEEAGLYVTLRTGSYEDPKNLLLKRVTRSLFLQDSQPGAIELRTEIEELLNG